MAIKIEAAQRLQADAESWFNSLTTEQQEEYVSLHPASKYADDVGTGKELDKTETKPAETKPDAPVKKTKKYVPHNKTNKPVKVTPKEVQEFVKSEHAEPDSETRRSFGAMIKAKAKGIVHHLKEEVKDAGVAGHAITKLFRRKKLTIKEKHALKSTAFRLTWISVSLMLGGAAAVAISESLGELVKEVAADFLNHGLTNAAEKTWMHASVLAASDNPKDSDEGLKHMTDMMSSYITSSPNFQAILAKHSS